MTQGADGRNVGRIDGWRRGSGAAMPLFHPHVLRDYALIADGERGAIVSPRGGKNGA